MASVCDDLRQSEDTVELRGDRFGALGPRGFAACDRADFVCAAEIAVLVLDGSRMIATAHPGAGAAVVGATWEAIIAGARAACDCDAGSIEQIAKPCWDAMVAE